MANTTLPHATSPSSVNTDVTRLPDLVMPVTSPDLTTEPSFPAALASASVNRKLLTIALPSVSRAATASCPMRGTISESWSVLSQRLLKPSPADSNVRCVFFSSLRSWSSKAIRQTEITLGEKSVPDTSTSSSQSPWMHAEGMHRHCGQRSRDASALQRIEAACRVTRRHRPDAFSFYDRGRDTSPGKVVCDSASGHPRRRR